MADDIWPEEVGVPTWLETPATNVGITLPTVTRPQILPLNDLTWENFERLCLRYVRGRAHVLRSQLYGVKGQAQHGIDLYARFAVPARYEVYQCKKLSELTGDDIQRAVDKFLVGKWRAESKAFRIMTAHGIEDAKISESIEAAGERLEAVGIEFEVLGASQISVWLKDQPSVVDDFFSRPWVEAFCGVGALQQLGKRLNAAVVADYRRELKRFYEVLFNNHDPGIPVPTKIGDQEIPLRDRFVTPEVYASLGGSLPVREAPNKDSQVQASDSQAVDESDQRRSTPVALQEIRIRSHGLPCGRLFRRSIHRRPSTRSGSRPSSMADSTRGHSFP